MKRVHVPKKWLPKEAPDPETVKALSGSLNISIPLAQLMAQRSIASYEAAQTFFTPALQETHDPFSMKGMKRVVQRIQQAIANDEPILIYGDYDVDGTTAVALVYQYFHNLTPHLFYYIPDRFKEGYGISNTGIDYAVENKATLMIALDCGIKAFDQVDYAKKHNVDIIICDHHTPGPTMPDAYAILNPKQADCTYPYKELSGCGIGFKLLQGYSQSTEQAPDPDQYLDLVAISNAADIVQITGENRILTHKGLDKINSAPIPPIQALMELSNAKPPLDVTDLVFKIGPRINACGRIGHAKDAVKLLTSKDTETAYNLGATINTTNTQRQNVDTAIRQEALQWIEDEPALQDRKTTVLYNPEWHKGVIGIVASRVMEHYFRPTILLTLSNGLAVGSGRSVPGFNLYEALEQCSHHLEQFGGHKAAAGLSLKPENIEAFTEQFEQVVSNAIAPEQLIPTLEYDLEISLEAINPKFANTLKRFAPFGPGNMKPLFVSRQITNAEAPRIVGEEHLKLKLKQGNSFAIDAIAFQMADFCPYLSNGRPFDICYTIEENRWNGQVSLQLNIKDIQIPENT